MAAALSTAVASGAVEPAKINVQLPHAASGVVNVLNKTPYLLPPRPDPDRRIVLVLGTIDKSGVSKPVTSPVLTNDLSLDRGRALDASRTPDYWLLVTDALNERVVYWSPVFVSRALRAEWKDKGASQLQGRSVFRSVPTYAVRVPFEPNGRIFVVEAAKDKAAVRAAGAFRARP